MSRAASPTQRLNVDEFERLVYANAFGTERVELLNGRVFFMVQGEPHVVAISRSYETFVKLKQDTDWVRCQGTIRLDEFSAPDPDFVWLPVSIGTPPEQWPLPLLVVEVSHKTYRRDSGPKLRKYGQRGYPEYWIENLLAQRVEVYRDPRNPTGKQRDCFYASIQHFVKGQSIPLFGRPDVLVPVDGLLP